MLRRLLLLCSFLAGAGIVRAQPQLEWERRNVLPGGQLLWSVVEGNAGIVAVGGDGRILHSLDGKVWTRCEVDTRVWLVAVTYGNGKYVAAGDAGTILTSPDGVNWNRVGQSGTTARLNNVAYGNGKFVAVGESGTIVFSEDGEKWSPAVSGVVGWLHGLAFDSGFWIATGQSGAVTSSYDGVKWSVSAPMTTAHLESIALGEVLSYEFGTQKWHRRFFLAVGSGGTALEYQVTEATVDGQALKSVSGRVIDNTKIPKTVRLGSVASYRSRYVVVGDNGKVYTAFNTYGTWSEMDVEPGRMLNAAGFAQGSLLVLGTDESIYQSNPIFPSRLGNISTRGQAGVGSEVMIAGTVVRGGPKHFLVRGIGPRLAGFGLTNVMPDPVLTVYDGAAKVVTSNAGWTTSPDASAIPLKAERVGAFPLPKDSRDAALLVTLNEGSYTFMLSSETNKTGLALIEAYDLDQLEVGGSRAINISTRGYVGTGDNILIAGFVIQGPSARTVLVRGVGPTMQSLFGLSGALGNPRISLFREDGTEIASNDDWGTATTYFGREITDESIRAASAATGAFPLVQNSKDAALLVVLAPGNYTVHLSGVNNSTGIAMVEAYEVPIN
jgi:hypothetical protein